MFSQQNNDPRPSLLTDRKHMKIGRSDLHLDDEQPIIEAVLWSNIYILNVHETTKIDKSLD